MPLHSKCAPSTSKVRKNTLVTPQRQILILPRLPLKTCRRAHEQPVFSERPSLGLSLQHLPCVYASLEYLPRNLYCPLNSPPRHRPTYSIPAYVPFQFQLPSRPTWPAQTNRPAWAMGEGPHGRPLQRSCKQFPDPVTAKMGILGPKRGEREGETTRINRGLVTMAESPTLRFRPAQRASNRFLFSLSIFCSYFLFSFLSTPLGLLTTLFILALLLNALIWTEYIFECLSILESLFAWISLHTTFPVGNKSS